jgi:4-hydroxy-tetrahydrodipicolinate synthase
MTTPLFKGIIPPVATIVTEDGHLDEIGMGRLIDHLISSGVNGLFFLGGAGEFCNMSATMRKQVAEFCVKYTNHRLPVLIGIGAPGTNETIDFGLHAKAIGADGVIAVNPYYMMLSEENLYQHYKKIAESVGLPVIIYNFPALTGQDCTPSLVKKLAIDCPNIVGIKDTVDTMGHIRELILSIKPLRPDFAVFAGYDEYLLGTLVVGGDGSIPASANFAPSLTCGIYRAFQEKNHAKMFELQNLLSHIPSIYSLDAPFVNAVKEAIKMTGVDISTHVLPPASPLSEEKKAILREILQRSQVIK